MPAPDRRPLPSTTLPYVEHAATLECVEAIRERDIVGVRRAVLNGAVLSMEGFNHRPASGPGAQNVTPTAIAALVDAAHDSLLMLPLVLYLGGDIDEVDTMGRTLLHLARTRRVARYLVGCAVPLEGRLYAELHDALSRAPGTRTFPRRLALGTVDNQGREPRILAHLRTGAAPGRMPGESRTVPRGKWRQLLSGPLYNGLVGIGFNEPEQTRRERDPLARVAMTDFVAEISVDCALDDALFCGNASVVGKLLALGADPNRRAHRHALEVDGVTRDIAGFSALATAVLDDCDWIECVRLHDGKEAGDEYPVESAQFFLPRFAGFGDLSGVHGPGGMSLMHLAREPLVARWLINQGAPCDVIDDKGRLPGDVLPPTVAAMVNECLLSSRMQEAVATARRPARRL